MNGPTAAKELIDRFDPITIEEMDRVKLQNRMDTKYAFSETELPGILEGMLADYRLLVVENARGTAYRSLYFDTAGLRSYLDHHNGRTFRSKTRFREYVGSDLVFLEVKRKTGRGGTDKTRKQVAGIPEQLDADDQAFVRAASGYDEPMRPILWNHFTRLTFVHRTRAERLTLDRDLSFNDARNERSLKGLCIAELKEERADRDSPFAQLMRDRRIRPSGLSKYCTGLILLGLAPKYNTFKAAMGRVARMAEAA